MQVRRPSAAPTFHNAFVARYRHKSQMATIRQGGPATIPNGLWYEEKHALFFGTKFRGNIAIGHRCDIRYLAGILRLTIETLRTLISEPCRPRLETYPLRDAQHGSFRSIGRTNPKIANRKICRAL